MSTAATAISAGQILTVSDDIAKALSAATTPDELRGVLEGEVTRQFNDAQKTGATTTADPTADAAKKVADDAAAATAAADAKAKAEAEAAKTAPQAFTRTESINGKDFTFEAGSELELERMVNQAFKIGQQFKAEQDEIVDPAIAAADAAKKAATEAAFLVDLELKFKRGEITGQDYIEKSGAISKYLESQGIPVAELKNTVEKGRTETYENGWKTATETFLGSAAGADWPGGARNLKLIGTKLAAMGLTDAEDKVGAITKAYAALKADDILFPPETTAEADAAKAADAAAQKAAADAAAAVAGKVDPATVSNVSALSDADKAVLDAARKIVADQQAAAAKAIEDAKRVPARSSGMFNQGSGVSESVQTAIDKAAAGQIPTIPADATPAEIMEIYKQANLKAGVNPDAAFQAAFGATRRP